jgi:hypothetical protein
MIKNGNATKKNVPPTKRKTLRIRNIIGDIEEKIDELK